MQSSIYCGIIKLQTQYFNKLDLNKYFKGNSMDLLSIVKFGANKLFNALKNFFRDSQIINEIYDEIDKNLFFPATQDERIPLY